MEDSLIFAGGWCSLLAAILFGVLGTISMKLSNSFQKIRPTLAMGLFYTLSFVAMTVALKTLNLSTVYATWSGLGTFLVMVLSVFIFNEKLSLKKALFMLLILIGIFGIHIADGSYPSGF